MRDGGEYIDSVIFTVDDANLKNVTVNGEAITPENGKYTLTASEKQQVVVAEDEAGNKTTVTVMVKASANNDNEDVTQPSENNNSSIETPQTGDRMMSIVSLMTGLLLISGLVMFTVGKKRRA